MNQLDETVIEKKFLGNLNKIASELITAHQLRFKQEIEYLNLPLLRWLNFRFRYVVPQSRQVVFSDNFPKTDITQDTENALQNLVN
jgi:hypothetical protein